MEPQHPDDLSITEQAFEWYDLLRTGGARERAAFAEWLRTSPRHVGEFLSVTAVYQEHAGVPFTQDIDVQELIAQATSNVVPLPVAAGISADLTERSGDSTPALVQKPSRFRFSRIAALFALFALFGGGVWLEQAGRYTTARGELRMISLEDGSTLHLNTQSSVRVRFKENSREIDLLSGEAMFKVAHDPSRPFRVHAGDVVIQAVGTEFNVQRRAAETMVSVIEGRVAVGSEASSSRQILAAGQSAELTEAATIASITPMDARKVTAWQQRRLIFRGDTLADVVAEFNRYNKAPQFLIADPAIAGRQFTGVFDANAPESFARILSGTGDLALSRRDAQIVISQREPSE